MAVPAIKTLLFSLALLISCTFAFGVENYYYFVPPKEWGLADPQKLASSVKIGFIGKGSGDLSPSMNLATEEVNVSLESYIKAIKKIHESDRKNRWRDLGNFSTSAGVARLIEIDTSSEFGAVRMMQMILIRNGMAYILTGAALKEEFNKYAAHFKHAFASLTFTSDLLAAIPQLERREKLHKKIETLKKDPASFKQFQESVIKDFSDMGAHWQIQVIQSSQR